MCFLYSAYYFYLHNKRPKQGQSYLHWLFTVFVRDGTITAPARAIGEIVVISKLISSPSVWQGRIVASNLNFYCGLRQLWKQLFFALAIHNITISRALHLEKYKNNIESYYIELLHWICAGICAKELERIRYG